MWERFPSCRQKDLCRYPSLSEEIELEKEDVFSLSLSIWLHVAGVKLYILQLKAVGSPG